MCEKRGEWTDEIGVRRRKRGVESWGVSLATEAGRESGDGRNRRKLLVRFALLPPQQNTVFSVGLPYPRLTGR